MQSTIEIEERALVDENQYQTILAHMQKIGTVHTSRRVMVNFTAMQYDRTKSVELRINDGALTKVIKKGSFGGTNLEETTTLDCTLEEALKIMAESSHTHAKISLRQRHVVTKDGYEYCLRDILHYDDPLQFGYPTLFEIESTTPGSHANEANIRAKLITILQSLGAEATNTAAFQAWSEYNHTQVDGDFVFSTETARELTRRLQASGFY